MVPCIIAGEENGGRDMSTSIGAVNTLMSLLLVSAIPTIAAIPTIPTVPAIPTVATPSVGQDPRDAADAADPPAAAPAPSKKVLVIGIDGLRPDALLIANTPNFDQLIATGCFSAEAQTDRHTISGAGWSTFLTGVWWPKHKVIDNSFKRPGYDQYPHFFTRIKEVRPDLITASFVTWMPLDMYLTNDENADFRFAHEYDDDGDAKAVDEAVRVLAEEDPDVTFFYFADVDVAGHTWGFHPDAPQYIAEIEQVDAQTGQLLEAVRGRATYDNEDWLILMSSDHGGTLDGSHGRNEPKHRTIPYLASGPSAARGTIYPTPNQVDIPVTAMTHLGIDIDPAWDLDGRVSGLQSSIELGVNLIFNGDAEYASGASEASINHGVAGWIDTSNMTVLVYGAPNGYPTLETIGPAQRGRNFFAGGAGGSEGDSSISQTIDVQELATLIDAHEIRFALSAHLGGFSDQRDFATLRATFLDEAGISLGESRVGPVTRADRQRAIGGVEGELTGLLPRATSGSVPPGTRRIRIVLEAEVGSGTNDGYADNLSLVLERR